MIGITGITCTYCCYRLTKQSQVLKCTRGLRIVVQECKYYVTRRCCYSATSKRRCLRRCAFVYVYTYMHDYIRQSFIREAQTHFKQHWSINTPKLDLSRTVTNNSLGGWGVGGWGWRVLRLEEAVIWQITHSC